MAIRIITGNPGSGKTYFCMMHLMRKYFQKDRIMGDWMPKNEVSIITNIEQIKLETYSFEEMVKTAGGLDKFFTVEYQKILLKRWIRIVYIIDEAGRWLGKDLKDSKVLFLFQYHRHLGLDFYLICPDKLNLNREIVALSEYVIHARARSTKITNGFVYDKVFEGEKAGSLTIPKKDEIFRLYKSMNKSEMEGVRSFTRKYFVYAGVACIIATFFFFISISHLIGGGLFKKNNKNLVSLGLVKNKESKVEVVKEVKKEVVKEEVKNVSNVNMIKRGPQSPEDLEDYTKVGVLSTSEGKSIIYTQDGRYWPQEMAGDIVKNGFSYSGAFYIRRKGAGVERTPSQTQTQTNTPTTQSLIPRQVQ
jgi:hypothetical protein